VSAKKGSGLGARMAAAAPVSAVAAGFAAATDSEPAAKAEVVALNVRLPRDLHRALREIAYTEETSINALLVQAAEKWLARRR
jgi:predicted HicB family RNase H-like nuclease